MPRGIRNVQQAGVGNDQTGTVTQTRRKVRRRRNTASRAGAAGGIGQTTGQTLHQGAQGRSGGDIPFGNFSARDWQVYNMGQRHCSTR